MIYVVLGMHKSGTTLVSQMLHKSGVSMDDVIDESVGYDQGNHWERRSTWLVNLDIVGSDEATYFSLDHYSHHDGPPTPGVAEAMRDVVGAAAREGDDWGFKDPLTCLTYPQWAQTLPPHRIVAVYRDPGEVMHHYRCPSWNVARAWRVLRAWSSYNAGVVRALEQHPGDAICLRYDLLMDGDDEMGRLEKFLGREVADMRVRGQYRARAGHPLHGPLERLMGATTPFDPAAVCARLEALRVRAD